MRRGMSASLLVALMASAGALAADGAYPGAREREPVRPGGKKTPGQMEARLREAEEKRLRKNAKRLNQRRRP
jgi:hypothetical protein